MSRLNPLYDLPGLADEVRGGFGALLRVLVGIGGLLADPPPDRETQDRWDRLLADLLREGRL